MTRLLLSSSSSGRRNQVNYQHLPFVSNLMFSGPTFNSPSTPLNQAAQYQYATPGQYGASELVPEQPDLLQNNSPCPATNPEACVTPTHGLGDTDGLLRPNTTIEGTQQQERQQQTAADPTEWAAFPEPQIPIAFGREDGARTAAIACVSERVNGAKNPAFKRAEVTLGMELFQFLNKGPLPTASGTVLHKDKRQTSWFSVNTRALASGLFHEVSLCSHADGADSAFEARYRQLQSEANLLQMKFEGLEARHHELVEQHASVITELETLQCDLDPCNVKHGRWGQRRSFDPVKNNKEAFRKHHDNLKPFDKLKHSSQLKFLSLHVHPRMHELFVLAGGTIDGFTAMLGLWVAKHTVDFHWEGSAGVKKAHRFISSLIALFSAVPAAYSNLEATIAPAKLQACVTTRKFIQHLDETNTTQRSANKWRTCLKGEVKLPAKDPCLAERKEEEKEREDLLGPMIRKERVVSKKGVDVMHEFFYHDPLRVLVDGMAPVALMESLQPKLAPKDLKKEAEDSIKILSEQVEAFRQGEVVTNGSEEWTPKHCEDASVEIVKAERLVAEATRNGSFSRKAFDDIMEDSLGALLHNQIRQAWDVLEMKVKGSWDHTQMLRTEGQAKSSITPFFLKILNSAFKVNSITNTMVWAAGDGKDGLDDQEEIIFEVNSLLGKLEEVQTINRPVLLKAHNGKLYWVTGIQLKVIMDLGLDGAALMDTVDTDDAPCSISSEYRCDRCWIAKLMDKRSTGKGYRTIGVFYT